MGFFLCDVVSWCLGQPQPVQGVTPLIRKCMVPDSVTLGTGSMFLLEFLTFLKGFLCKQKLFHDHWQLCSVSSASGW